MQQSGLIYFNTDQPHCWRLVPSPWRLYMTSAMTMLLKSASNALLKSQTPCCRSFVVLSISVTSEYCCAICTFDPYLVTWCVPWQQLPQQLRHCWPCQGGLVGWRQGQERLPLLLRQRWSWEHLRVVAFVEAWLQLLVSPVVTRKRNCLQAQQ